MNYTNYARRYVPYSPPPPKLVNAADLEAGATLTINGEVITVREVLNLGQMGGFIIPQNDRPALPFAVGAQFKLV